MMRVKVDKRAPRILVQVSSEIILKSRRGDSKNCMIRNAVKESRPDALYIEVDIQWVRFTEGDYRYRYPLPTKAAYNLASFESGDEVKPFQFQLRDGRVFVSGSHNAQPGSPAAIRYWARTQGIAVKRTGGISVDVSAKYFQAHPEIQPAPSKPSPMRSERSRRKLQLDRFYGLKMPAGFKPGGEPTDPKT